MFETKMIRSYLTWKQISTCHCVTFMHVYMYSLYLCLRNLHIPSQLFSLFVVPIFEYLLFTWLKQELEFLKTYPSWKNSMGEFFLTEYFSELWVSTNSLTISGGSKLSSSKLSSAKGSSSKLSSSKLSSLKTELI